MRLLTIGLFFFFSVLPSSFACESYFDIGRERAYLANAHSNLLHDVKHAGVFVNATLGHQQKIEEAFISWKAAKDRAVINPHVVLANVENTRQALPFSPAELLRPSSEASLDRQTQLILAEYGYRAFAGISILASHAGLWTRGGGSLVKGLIPLNLSELLSGEEISALARVSDTLKKTKSLGEHHEEIAAASEFAQQTIYHQLDNLKAHPAVLMTLLQAAIISDAYQYYVHCDFWTAAGTHNAIRHYRGEIEKNVDKLILSNDESINHRMRLALKKYLAASRDLGETNIFGMQIGVQNIIAEGDQLFVDSLSKPASEGAGMWPFYFEVSGRAEQLRKRGVRTHLFRNAEVIGPILDELAVLRQSGLDLAYTVVLKKDGDAGGDPYVDLSRPGFYPMLEQSNVPEEMRKGGVLFNTNTILMNSWPANYPWTPYHIAFEPAARGAFKPKVNAGDPTLDMPSVLILGERPDNYENIKSLLEFIENGPAVLDAAKEKLIRHIENGSTYR